jgi:hypothetical protein
MSHPSPRTAAPPSCLPLYIKDLLKEDTGFLMEVFWWGFLIGCHCRCCCWLCVSTRAAFCTENCTHRL